MIEIEEGVVLTGFVCLWRAFVNTVMKLRVP
jgi:hypothetical protein